MNRYHSRFAVLTLFVTLLAASQALGQSFGRGDNYTQTRNELAQILRQYPPRLQNVLALDPTLLGNEEYLAPYPDLLAFLKVHPEIARDPDFFLSDDPVIYLFNQKLGMQRGLDDRTISVLLNEAGIVQDTPSQRMWSRVMNVLVPTGIFFTALAIVTWIVRAVIDHRRWLRVSRMQAEAHSRLMDRFTSNEELLAYLQTPAGKQFANVSALPVDVGPVRSPAPVGRILWSVQVGLVLLVGGLAITWAGTRVSPEASEVLTVLSVIGMALGASFLVGAGASYAISERLGLLDQLPRQRPDNVEPPAGSS